MKILTLLVGALGLAAMAGAAAATTGAFSPIPANPDPVAATPVQWDPQITEFDRVLGSPDAPVTILEFASLSCPHCAEFHAETLPALKEQFIDTGRAKLVYRDFPLNAPALMASQLAHCVPEENFFPVIGMMFSTQAQWLGGSDPEDALIKLVAFAGLPPEAARQCLANEELRLRIAGVRQTAQEEYEVNSTPTFIVNGEKLVGAQPLSVFAEAIEDAGG